ncbi:MAG TPA: Mrp/NBP35 family ATP-binding protein [Gemmatimonadales bacterium]|nr:Mrp/NBP35 family ATP-binding protein [Gemmatimonadales bacterium]
MTGAIEGRVFEALSRIRNERIGNDLVSAGMVRDLTADDSGRVSFTFLLGNDDPGTLVRVARKAVEGIEGVTEVKINVTNPSGPARATHAPPGAQPAGQPPVAAPTPEAIPGLGHVVAISSGKGGVGKSTVAANLAVALAQAGHRVGVMDADVYGPNMPRMFGVHDRPMVDPASRKIQPLEAYGVRIMSLGLLVERDAPAIWRGPIIMKIIQQFLRDVEWGELDYFIVDLPPGTGDAQLSLVQATSVGGAIIVTTPQEMAVGDALRGAKMFEKVGVPVLGIVENMSGFTDPETGRHWRLFSSGGGQRLADELGVPLLGSIPLQPGLADAADEGRPVLVSEPASPAAGVLRGIAERVHDTAARQTVTLPILRG